MEQLVGELSEVLGDVDRIVERNFQSDVFVNPSVIEDETRERLDVIANNERGIRLWSDNRRGAVVSTSDGSPFS